MIRRDRCVALLALLVFPAGSAAAFELGPPVALTDNDVNDQNVAASDGAAVWQRFDGSDWDVVHAYQGVETLLGDETMDDVSPDVDAGAVVWRQLQGGQAEVMHFDGATTTQVTADGVNVEEVRISDGDVVFVRGGGDQNEIYRWDGAAITQLTGDLQDDGRVNVDAGVVVYRKYLGSRTLPYDPMLNNIFVWDGAETQYSPGGVNEAFPDVSGDNLVFRRQLPGEPDTEVVLDDGVAATLLTDDMLLDVVPRVDGGNVVWQHFDGTDWEIRLWDGEKVVAVTDNTLNDLLPVVDGNRVLWQQWDGNDWEIMLASPGACDDGIDNDGDGLTDAGEDPGCATVASPRENPACDNGLDDDGDGGVDWLGNPPDPECVGQPWREKEQIEGCGLGAELALLLPLLAALRRDRRTDPHH